MTDKKYRVAVWSTGGIGSIAITAIARRTDLELVGVWVFSEEKDGKDSGELANGVPNGVPATRDVDALIALQPDVVVYAASGFERDVAAVPDYVKLLSAGINVVTTTSTNLVNPVTYEPEFKEQLEKAAAAGGATIYASGMHPGWALDQVLLLLTTGSKSIKSIYAAEYGMYDDYGVEAIMKFGLGFGMPMDFTPFVATPGALAGEHKSVIRMIADNLGIELDEIVDDYDRQVTDRDLDVAMGKVEAGTVGAIRMKAVGKKDGQDFITIEHVTRLARDVAPDWPIGPQAMSYVIKIDGDPDLDVVISPSLKDPAAAGIPWMGSGAGAMVATAMRVINAIPQIVAAKPGIATALDLPFTLPRDVYEK